MIVVYFEVNAFDPMINKGTIKTKHCIVRLNAEQSCVNQSMKRKIIMHKYVTNNANINLTHVCLYF